MSHCMLLGQNVFPIRIILHSITIHAIYTSFYELKNILYNSKNSNATPDWPRNTSYGGFVRLPIRTIRTIKSVSQTNSVLVKKGAGCVQTQPQNPRTVLVLPALHAQRMSTNMMWPFPVSGTLVLKS